jgi:hypothetical protein
MKRVKTLRTLEQLWDLEDRHPLVDPSTGGLLRWMLATGSLATSTAAATPPRSRRANIAGRRAKNVRS